MDINPEIDLSVAATTLASQGRVQIHDFVSSESAKSLYDLLQQHDDWYLSYNEGPDNFETSEAEFAALTLEQKHRFTAGVYRRARSGFQYLFKQYYISQAVASRENQGHPMHAVHDWVTGEDFLNLMRDVTGRDDIRTSDSYASLYGPGHFLTRHDDRHHTHQRIAAWVLSMTPEWNENWGGHLAFYDEAGNVEQAFKPAFNTLNLFTVPQHHAVQLVTPFAGAPRTSYLGWLLA